MFFCFVLQIGIFITKVVGQLGVGFLGDVGCLGLTIEKDSQLARRADCNRQWQVRLVTVGL